MNRPFQGSSAVTDSNEDCGEPRFEFTRRTFMEQTGRTGSAAFLAQYALSSATGHALGQEEWEPTDELPGVDEEALLELDVDEARVVQAMAARIMPSDEFGPGAVDAGVVYFIDRQLNGAWGYGENFYLEPPFRNRYEGAKPNHGYQASLLPREIYKLSVDWVNDYAQREYGAEFTDLSPEQQDQVLLDVQNNEPDNFSSIMPEEFFQILRRNTLEGMYCDPAYEGNRDMVGWKMKEFPGSPGALGTYRDLVQEEEFLNLTPRSVEDDVEAVGIETGVQDAIEGATAGSGGGGNGTSGNASGGAQESGEAAESRADHSHGHDSFKHGEDTELPGEGKTGDPVPGHGPRWELVDTEDSDGGADAAANDDVARSPESRKDGGEKR